MDSRLVFVDTNIDTHIAVPVFPDITEKEFKGELERFHVHCCPEVGNITVKRIMVKKGSRYYQPSESLPLKHLFCGSDATWFLHAIITAGQINSSETESISCKFANDVMPPVSLICSSPCKKISRRRKKSKTHKLLSFNGPLNLSSRAPAFKFFQLVYLFQRKGKRKKRCNSGSVNTPATTAEVIANQEAESKMVTETFNENLSESACVSGIIKKYFSDYDEVDSTPCTNRKILYSEPGFASPVTCPSFRVSRSLSDNKPTSETSGLKSKKPEVGRRLLHAIDSLGLSPNDNQFAASLRNFSNRKSAISKSSVSIRSLVFEIPEDSD